MRLQIVVAVAVAVAMKIAGWPPAQAQSRRTEIAAVETAMLW